MAQQAIVIYISQEGGEVSDLEALVDGTEVELDWVGSLNGEDIPVKVRLAEENAHFGDIAERQGWNTDSMLRVMSDFIARQGLMEQLDEHAAEVAAEENSGSES